MVLISLMTFFISFAYSIENLPRFLTKQPIDNLRFISMDGRYAYVVRKPGVLGLITSFNNNDFLSTASTSDFLVSGSRFQQRLIIETIPNAQTEFYPNKNHQISVVDFGNSKPRLIGEGRNPKLHLQDEWITYYNTLTRTINVENLLTTKKFQISLNGKPFFIPDMEMVSNDTLVYTDINEQGHSGLINYNLITQKSTIIYKSPLSAMRLELCQNDGYLAIGEFPYESVTRGSKILQIKVTSGTNIAGYETIYNSQSQDLGQIVCAEKSLYFIKTTKQHKRLGVKTTEAAQLNLSNQTIKIRSSLGHVTQLLMMDGRVLIPYREDFYVLEGTSNLSDDKLRPMPDKKEELPLDV